MRKDQLLEKILWKAIKNEWNVSPYRRSELFSELYGGSLDYREFIFDHEFAKAFWGEEKESFVTDMFSDGETIREMKVSWKYHLQQMVLEKEPLKYLEKYL